MVVSVNKPFAFQGFLFSREGDAVTITSPTLSEPIKIFGQNSHINLGPDEKGFTRQFYFTENGNISYSSTKPSPHNPLDSRSFSSDSSFYTIKPDGNYEGNMGMYTQVYGNVHGFTKDASAQQLAFLEQNFDRIKTSEKDKYGNSVTTFRSKVQDTPPGDLSVPPTVMAVSFDKDGNIQSMQRIVVTAEEKQDETPGAPKRAVFVEGTLIPLDEDIEKAAERGAQQLITEGAANGAAEEELSDQDKDFALEQFEQTPDPESLPDAEQKESQENLDRQREETRKAQEEESTARKNTQAQKQKAEAAQQAAAQAQQQAEEAKQAAAEAQAKLNDTQKQLEQTQRTAGDLEKKTKEEQEKAAEAKKEAANAARTAAESKSETDKTRAELSITQQQISAAKAEAERAKEQTKAEQEKARQAQKQAEQANEEAKKAEAKRQQEEAKAAEERSKAESAKTEADAARKDADTARKDAEAAQAQAKQASVTKSITSGQGGKSAKANDGAGENPGSGTGAGSGNGQNKGTGNGTGHGNGNADGNLPGNGNGKAGGTGLFADDQGAKGALTKLPGVAVAVQAPKEPAPPPPPQAPELHKVDSKALAASLKALVDRDLDRDNDGSKDRNDVIEGFGGIAKELGVRLQSTGGLQSGRENQYFATTKTSYAAVDEILKAVEKDGVVDEKDMEAIQKKLNEAGATLRTKGDEGVITNRNHLMERIKRVEEQEISIK